MHVCKTLSPQNESGLQTCLEWADFSQLTFNSDQAIELIIFAVSCFVIMFIVRLIRNLLENRG